MAKRRRTGNRTFPKRATLWSPFDNSVTLTSATSPIASTTLLAAYFSQTGEELPIGSTIGPIRGTIVIIPSVTTTFSLDQRIRGVLQLLPEGGRTQVAVPRSDILDSMWYGSLDVTAPAVETAAGVFGQGPTSNPFVTKALRKITGNGQELIFTAESSNNADYIVRVYGNLMIRLP